MASVGVRELRQRASELLRRVEAGETIEVTDRGRPVALLSPIPAADPLAQLEASGDLIRGRQRLDDLPPPLPLEPGHEPPSRVLKRLRRDER
jgi:prevent-host-death family protein